MDGMTPEQLEQVKAEMTRKIRHHSKEVREWDGYESDMAGYHTGRASAFSEAIEMLNSAFQPVDHKALD